MIVLVVLAAQSWVWWHPPAAVSKAACHGLSLERIARLSPEAWARVAKDDREDAANDVYGVALRAQNRREDGRTEQFRMNAFLYGMACIAVEDTLAGGGTYSIHAPHALFAASERTIQALIRRHPRPSLARKDVEPVERTLRRCLTLRESRASLVGGGPVDLPRLRKFAALALRYERTARRLAEIYPLSVRADVDGFVVDWGRDYLAVRGADEVLKP